MFQSQDSFEVASQLRGFSSSGRNSCDKTRQVTRKIFHDGKKKIIEMSMSHTQLRPFREVSADF